MPLVFKTRRKLRFADCDPAGIAFYPRLVEHINSTVEDWFEDAIGISFHEMHLKRAVGVPTRALSVDFVSPARLGDMIDWHLSVAKLGRSSIHLVVDAYSPSGKKILRATSTLVWCDFSGSEPKPQKIPDEVRATMMRYEVEA